MKIDVDGAAMEYIKEKGGEINIDMYISQGCCAGIAEPVINFGKPKKFEEFNEYLIGDVKIYVSKYIHLKGDTLAIKFNKFLGIKNLSVTGIKIL